MLLLQFIILSSYKKAVNQKANSFHTFHFLSTLYNEVHLLKLIAFIF